MNRIPKLILAAVLSGAAMLFAIPLAAQVPEIRTGGQTAKTSGDAIRDLKLADVEAALSSIEADAGMDEAVKAPLRSKYNQAIENLKQADSLAVQTAAYRESLQTAPQSAHQARSDLQALPSAEDAAKATPFESIEDLKRDVDAQRTALSVLTENRSRITADLTQMRTRPVEIGTRLPEVQQELSAVEKQLGAIVPVASDPGRVADRVVLQATRAKLQSELGKLQQEQLSLSAREDLLNAQAQLLTRQVENATAALSAQEASLHDRLTKEANRVSKVASALPQGDVEVEKLANEVRLLALEFQGSVESLKLVRNAQEKVKAAQEELTKEADGANEQLKLGGRGGAMAQLLFNLENRANSIQTEMLATKLPSVEQIRSAAIQNAMALSKQREKEKLFANHRFAAVSDLVTARHEVLQDLQSQYKDLTHELVRYESAKKQCLNKIEQIVADNREQLLWMRTCPPFSLETLTDIPSSLQWSISLEHRLDLWEAAQAVFTRVPLRSMAVALAVAVLLLIRRRLIAHIEKRGLAIRRISTDRYAHTSQTLMVTLLLAAPIPILMAYMAWVLGQTASEWLLGVAYRLLIASWVALAATVVTAISRPGGLGSVHFGWRQETLDRFRLALRRIVVVYIPALMLINSYYLYEQAAEHFGSVGRISFILSHIWIAFVLWQLFRGPTGVLLALMNGQPDHWITRSRRLWFPLLMACPIGLIVLAFQGYLIAAFELSLGLMVTVALIVAGAVGYGLVSRWFRMKQRKFALEEALERRRAMREAASQDEQAPEGEIVTVESEDEVELDLDAISDQTQAILRLMFHLGMATAIVVYWSGMFPVDEVLRAVPIPLIQGRSLFDLALVVLIGITTFIAVKNLPGLLELAILRTRELEPGTRHAISTLCQYGCVAFGVALALNVWQVDWAKFGWIAAALSVGLGFGLQEVVANFVCGLILLFERPVRVGDIITIEGTTGTVTNIRMRATTITNWDREELVVPNKTLITNTLLNLTLSSPLNRILVPVGIAYGSDTERARQILLDVAADHPRVLDDPAPMATFDQFADSSLNLVLRVFLPDRDNRLGTITELHTEITKRFAEAGIEIAFPQQDVHLRSGWQDTRRADTDGSEEG